MRRFDYDDNEDFQEEVDNFFDGNQMDPDHKKLMEEELALQQMQVGVAHRDLTQRLLFRITRMLEKSPTWETHDLDTKLKMIEQAYKRLRKLEEE